MFEFTASSKGCVVTRSDLASRITVPASASLVTTPKLVPLIATAPGGDIRAILKSGVLHRAGIYAGVWCEGEKSVAYGGQSGWSVANRLADAKFSCPNPVDLVVGIGDEGDRLTGEDTRVLERLLHLQLVEAGFKVHGTVPAGAVVPPERDARLRTFFAEICVSLKSAGLLFRDRSTGNLLAGPVTAPGIVSGDVPDGNRFVLDTPLGAAEMVEFRGAFVVLPGSPARFDGGPAGKAVGVVAQELIHDGILIPIVDDWYEVAKPICLGSSSAAARFVTGAVAGSPEQWHGLATGGPSRPTRVAIGQVPRNVSRRVAAPPASTNLPQTEEALHV